MRGNAHPVAQIGRSQATKALIALRHHIIVGIGRARGRFDHMFALAFALDQVTGKAFRFHLRFRFQMGGLRERFFHRTQNQLQQEIGHDQLVALIEEAFLPLVFREET